MHEGFVNYNAGTLGTSMIEGRVSAGVVVGDGSDIGGGASIMGTLSGGGKQVISIGERCLLGANAGIGISLGDDCVVAAGTYVTAGTKVTLPDGSVVKARELSGQSGWLYWHNSVNGSSRGHSTSKAQASRSTRRCTPTTDCGSTTYHRDPRGAGRDRLPAPRAISRGTKASARYPTRELHGHRRWPHGRDVHRTSRERGPDRCRGRAARTTGPSRHHRDRDGIPRVEADQSRRRRPRFPRHLPAAAESRLGHARSRS